ncbi:helix-turn-helix domain-containing protein [Zavarzinia aquatilis]|uniref:HTH cro/C1-type domain-containing protein n=1 Tax=Zavarzinia aquatilis TaxID=2211142 RepID=A0A317EDY0_9PROT|nr:hypothetical protein DKG74_04115 [Zavarzinia aquatilis]
MGYAASVLLPVCPKSPSTALPILAKPVCMNENQPKKNVGGRPRKDAPPGPPPNRLTELRERQGLSQVDLAKRANIAATAVSKYERGALGISLEKLGRLSKALKCQPWEIVPNQIMRPDEWDALNIYNKLKPDERERALRLLMALVQ